MLSRRLYGAAVAACAAGAVFLLTGVLYKAITYHEEEIYFLSSWGYTWNELFVRHVVDTERSPWVQVNYEIHEGRLLRESTWSTPTRSSSWCRAPAGK